MSYILDALKKSEQMRKQGDVPDLQTVHVSLPDEEKPNRGLYFIIVFLLMSIAFLIGIYQPWQDVDLADKKMSVEVEPSPLPAPVSTAKPTPEIIEKNITRPEPVLKTVKNELPIKKEPEPVEPVVTKTEQEISQQAIRQVPRLSELSPVIQQAIPNMVFAGHVYSSSASQRSIIINGYAMSEGDVVVDGLRVKQITRDGVIFDYQGQLFREEILQDWSFD